MRLACAALAGILCAGPARAGDWEAAGGLFFAQLDDRDYGEGGRAREFFRPGYGLDLSIGRRLIPELTIEAGANSIRFIGKRGGESTGTSAAPEEFAAHAVYAGLRFAPPVEKGLTVYGRFDAGLSILEDVRHAVTRAGADRGSEPAFEGGTDLYLGFGAGLAFKWNERWEIDAGWEIRHYGRLNGLEDQAAQNFPTEDLIVSASGFRLGATYRF